MNKLIKTTMIALPLTLALTGCAHKVLNEKQSVSMVSAKQLSASQVKKAILKGGRYKGWNMTPVKPGKIVGVYTKGSHVAKVNIAYSRSNYAITYAGSQDMDKRGDTINRHYNNWVKYLKISINNQLKSMR